MGRGLHRNDHQQSYQRGGGAANAPFIRQLRMKKREIEPPADKKKGVKNRNEKG